MKTLIVTLVAAFMLTTAYAANTNSPTLLEQATVTAREAVQTNLNEVIVDILRGVKTAGGEVYQASKTAITKSVDFTMEQAPLVVKEFLAWKVAEAVGYLLIWIAIVSLSLWISHKILKSADGNPGDEWFFGWVIRVSSILALIAALGINGMKITKVLVAPRVYLIEYVVDALHGTHHR
jgi:hypothetical protein